MKLEFLASGARDCRLIRIYEFTAEEAHQLRRIAIQLAGTKETRVFLHKQPNVNAIGGCELTLHQGEKDRGVSEISPLKFDWILSQASWLQVAGLIRPFSREGATGFQWLSQPKKVQILLSFDGKW